MSIGWKRLASRGVWLARLLATERELDVTVGMFSMLFLVVLGEGESESESLPTPTQ